MSGLSGNFTNNSVLLGNMGFKGARGYSAYEIAVQHGFKGTEQDWLATLGTASYFDRGSDIYITTTLGENEFNVPDCYTSNSFIDVYVEGERLNSDEYTVNTSTKKINLTTPLDVIGTKVEVVTLTMSTNSLPIGETIDENSTNETAPGSKAVYDFVKPVKDDIRDLQNDVTGIVSEVTTLDASITEKFDKENIVTLSGSVSNIAAGSTETVDINYPSGFTKANTLIIGRMVSSNSNYYETADLTDTASGFPVIKQIALIDSGIRIWMKNNNSSQARIGYYKITLMKL